MSFLPQVQGVVDTGNSTSTPLTSGQLFTGQTKQIQTFAAIVVNVYTDISSPTDGLSVEFSTNSTNWDLAQTYSVKAYLAYAISVPVLAQYYRVKYQNTTDSQSEFRLQTLIMPYTSQQPISVIDNSNSTKKSLGAGGVYSGITTSILGFTSLTVTVSTDQNSSTNGFQVMFSSEGETFDNIYSYTITGGVPVSLPFSVINKYFKVSLTNNSSTDQTYLRIQTVLSTTSAQPIVQVNAPVSSQQNSVLTTSVLQSLNYNGRFSNLLANNPGCINISIQDPSTVFGEASMAQNNIVFQDSFLYGVNSLSYYTCTPNSAGAGRITVVDGAALIDTAESTSNMTILRTLKSITSKNGQGSLLRFAASFSASPATGNNQLVGFGNSASGLFFGYQDSTFGVLRLGGGVLQVNSLIITTAPTSAGTFKIILYDITTPREFLINSVTGLSFEQTAAYIAEQLFDSLYPGWDVSANGPRVTFICKLAQSNTGGTDGISLTPGGSGIDGTVGLVINGVAPTTSPASTVSAGSEFVAQNNWNLDVMDGSNSVNNPSGIFLRPSLGNTYQITFQPNGYGSMVFSIQNGSTGRFVPVHIFKYPNTYTNKNLANPNYYFQAITQNTTNTTAVGITLSSVYAAVQGQIANTGLKHSYSVLPFAMTQDTPYQIFAIQQNITNSATNILNTTTIVPISFSYNVNDTGGTSTSLIVRLDFYTGVVGKTILYSTTNSWTPVLTPDGTDYRTTQSNSLVYAMASPASPPTTNGNLVATYFCSINIGGWFDLTSYNIRLSTNESLYVVATPINHDPVNKSTAFSFQWMEE